MYPRVNYEMTEADLKELLEVCKPTPCVLIGGYSPPTPLENANAAWQKLGGKMGFDFKTVLPIPGKGNRFFTAVPLENETQRAEREAREAEEKRLAEIQRLEMDIAEKQAKLESLKGGK